MNIPDFEEFSDISGELKDVYTKLKNELAEARRDAERYRWLREAQNDDIGVVQGFGAVDVGSTGVADTYERVLYRANLDAAIDAARGGEG